MMFLKSRNHGGSKESSVDTATSTPTGTRHELDASCLVPASLARAETRVINCLRAAVLLVLLITMAVVATGVYLYTRNEEQENFTSHVENSAHQVIDNFHDGVERNLGAAASLSTAFTSFAMETDQKFPFVTLPDFEQRGSHFRSQSGSHVLHYLPLVTDENRAEWEDYANNTRGHIDTAFERDSYARSKQDTLFGLDGTNDRALQEDPERNMTILDDGTEYHAKIWSNGAMAPLGDDPEGSGPYFPTWQRRCVLYFIDS